MVGAMMVRYCVYSHLNLNRFSTPVWILNLVTLYTAVLGSLLVLLISSVFLTQEIVRDAMSQLKSGKYDGSMFYV